MLIKDIIKVIEAFAPPALKEDFDNVGLLVGDANHEATGALITLDITEEVIAEAKERNCNLVIAHHPIMLSGIKRITGRDATERILIDAIKNDIAIYAAHTNVDSVMGGVSGKMCEKLGLINCRILAPKKDSLIKLVTFVPKDNAEAVRQAIFEAGAGVIGNYDCCSFNVSGTGTFRAGEESDPYVGEKGKIHHEDEVRIETILPKYLKSKVVMAMIKAHTYEEVAYDIYPLCNDWNQAGLGMIGELPSDEGEHDFLTRVKEIFKVGCIRHTEFLNKPIQKVAVCGGSGSFLLGKAKAAGADVFVTGDFKYHQFFDAEGEILIADIGHFESEQFTKEVFFELLTKKISNFAVHLSNVNTNTVKYF